jgi:hypothetical protein
VELGLPRRVVCFPRQVRIRGSGEEVGERWGMRGRDRVNQRKRGAALPFFVMIGARNGRHAELAEPCFAHPHLPPSRLSPCSLSPLVSHRAG